MTVSKGFMRIPSLARGQTGEIWSRVTFDATDGVAGTPVTVFTLTGHVLLEELLCTCSTDLVSAGAGQISLGTATNVAGMIAATVATEIDANELWVDTAPDPSTFPIHSAASPFAAGIVLCESLILTITVGNITAGVLDFYAVYEPITDNGRLS